MKTKRLISLALLLALSFGIIHEYAFAMLDNNHCSASEYINELDNPSSHNDICDIHFEYHQSIFLLSQNIILPKIEKNDFVTNFEDESYYFYNPLEFFKPPIS